MTNRLSWPPHRWARSAFTLFLTLTSLVFMPGVQGATTATPRIDVLDVTPTDDLSPGTPLSIRLEGTANGQASTKIQGVSRSILLKEVQDGIYEADYTLRKTDRLPRNASVKATLRIGKRSATSLLDGGLTLATQAATTVANSGAVITRFVNAPLGKIEPGADLDFTVEGSPGAKAIVRVPGIRRDIALEEVSSGHYEGSYTVRQSDKPAADARATARLTLAGKTAESTLNQALASAATVPAVAGTSAEAVVVALPLKITSHQPNAVVGSGAVTVSGTTLPGAGIDVSVMAVASLGGLGLNQSLLKERVEADAKGNFTFTFRPPVALRGVRYDIMLAGYKGAQTGTVNLSLTQSK